MSRSRRASKWFTQKRVAELLLVAWAVTIVLAAAVPVYPQVSDSPYPDQAVFPAPCNQKDILTPNACSTPSQIPHMFVTFAPTFSAEDGVFAANNPITISATMHVNRSDFMTYYGGVGFFGSAYLNGTSQGVQLLISRVNNYTYEVSGTLVWPAAAPVYWFLVPQQQYFTTFLLGPHSNTTAVMLNVTGAENTVAMKAT